MHTDHPNQIHGVDRWLHTLWQGSAERGVHSEEHGHDHSPRAMCRCHDKRPTCKVPEVNLHADPGRMAATEQLVTGECQEDDSASEPQKYDWDRNAQNRDGEGKNPNRDRVTQSNWQKSLKNGGTRLSLQTQSNREQPAHRRIQTMPRSQ